MLKCLLKYQWVKLPRTHLPEVLLPTHTEIERTIEEMRIQAGNAHIAGSENRRLNKLILWYSRRIAPQSALSDADTLEQNRVALSAPLREAATFPVTRSKAVPLRPDEQIGCLSLADRSAAGTAL